VDGRTLIFGVSGQLLSSNLVMFDRETISLWQQVSGEAYAGEFEGKKLERILVQMVSFGSWRTAHPDGVVMEEPASDFDYGRDPYATSPDDPTAGSKFFGVPGSAERGDDRLLPKARLIGVQTSGGRSRSRCRRAGVASRFRTRTSEGVLSSRSGGRGPR